MRRKTAGIALSELALMPLMLMHLVARSTLTQKAGSLLHPRKITGCDLQSSVARDWLNGLRLSAAAQQFLTLS